MKKPSNKSISFNSLHLSAKIVQAVTEKGYTIPTAIQAQAIPAIIQGRNVMAAAQTGTGKTAGFTLPILNRLSEGEIARKGSVHALILTPTRELASQVYQSVKDYGKNLHLNNNVVFGGVNIRPQIHRLRRGTDILIATPGRLLDLYQRGAMNFKALQILVLDEADRMLDMGFLPDIKKITALLPANRQSLLFSATFSHAIRKLAKSLVRNPLEISVTPRNTTVESIEQLAYSVPKQHKSKFLTHMILNNNWGQALIFSRTKHGANKLARNLGKKGINADAIHGNKSQGARTKALAKFKKGSTQILVATDIAARGLDINQLPQVVNFDMPSAPNDYIHRIGRTGRAGAAGQAISLVSPEERSMLSDIEKLIKQTIVRKKIKDFVV